MWAFVLQFAIGCNGLITKLSVDRDPRSVFEITSFGYEEQGEFDLTITDFDLKVPLEYKKNAEDMFDIAFILQRSESSAPPEAAIDGKLDEEGNRICYHTLRLNDDDQVYLLSSGEQWKKSHFTKTISVPGFYHLYFSNCELDTQASFELDLTQYNLDSNQNKIYLSAGSTNLPSWFFGLCILFALELLVWIGVLVKNRADVKKIHYLMAVVVVFKTLTLFCESFKYQSLKYGGTNTNSWAIPFYIFSLIKGMLMFATIVLIGTGWSYLKPFLTERDKHTVIIVLVIQLMVNVAAIVLDEEAPGAYGWLTWRDILHLADMVCCCIILLPIVNSIQHLRDAAAADGKAALTLIRLKNFRSFYLLVVVYVYFTRIIVFLLGATLSFERTWIGQVCAEAAGLLFYFMTGYMFRPQPRNPYISLGEEDGAVEAPYAVNMRDNDSDDDFFDDSTNGVEMTQKDQGPKKREKDSDGLVEVTME